jgi:hypothetical protein
MASGYDLLQLFERGPQAVHVRFHVIHDRRPAPKEYKIFIKAMTLGSISLIVIAINIGLTNDTMSYIEIHIVWNLAPNPY